MASKVPLNTRQPDDLVERIKADATRSNRSVGSVVELALIEFFRRPLTERRAIYQARPVKKAGAPIQIDA